MPHDDDQKCVAFSSPANETATSALYDDDSLFSDTNNNDVSYVMSRMLDHNTNPWEWSKCSRNYVTAFFE